MKDVHGTPLTGDVPQSRPPYVPQMDVWLRFRCDCGTAVEIMRDFARARIKALKNKGDYFVVNCPNAACRIQHIFKPKVWPLA